ncbi:MAG: hypothetical protein ACRCTD_10480 [Beijerinckiaceae bacterium]
MPLRGRVGKHLSTGRQCQNWKADQQTVIALLNRIPSADAGTEGKLTGPVIGGLANRTLCEAIVQFEKKHFGTVTKGYVDPGGSMLQRMEMLAARPAPAPPPKPPGQWDSLVSKQVTKSLRVSLLDDGFISHEEAVNIVRSTLSDGKITANEIKDLYEISKISRNLPPASKLMFESLYNTAQRISGAGPFYLPSEQHRFAAGMACDFMERQSARHFPKLNRYEVGVGILMRIANPGLMNQDQSSLCGPTALLFHTASDNPIMYARYAIDLYEKGRANINRLYIKPGSDVRNYKPPASMDQVDWMTMASIRDSENAFLDYDTVDKAFAGMTLPGELADWFRRAGYSDIRNVTNVSIDKGTGTVDAATRLFNQGYRVCLFIAANMLKEADQTDGDWLADHWVVLRSPIDRTNDKVRMKVFTWGNGEHQVPNGSKDLSVSDFLDNFYGYVAAKP